MKLLFKVEGGRSFGMGRVTRSVGLAREIRGLQSVEINFLVNDDAVSVGKVRAAGFGIEITPPTPEAFAQMVIRRGYRAVVFDQETEIEPYTSPLRNAPNVLLVALDCFEMENDGLHVIVNLLNHSQRSRPVSGKVRYLEGLDFAIIRSEFDPYIGGERHIAKHAHGLLVSFGGADPRGNTLRVLQGLKHAGKRDLSVDVTLGCNFTNPGLLEEVAAELPFAVAFHRDPRDIEALMHACDLAITGGGTTLLEAAALGTPVLVIAQTAAEERFSKMFEASGSAVSLGLGGEHDGETIWRCIGDLLDDQPKRGAMSTASRKLVDGRGRQRLAALVLEGAAQKQMGPESSE